MAKKILSLGLVVIACFSLTACRDDPNRYTEEQHIQRVTERVEQRLKEGKFKYSYTEPITDFSVYPLYTQDDKLAWFLVEFEPKGFALVEINKDNSIFSGLSMYSVDAFSTVRPWQRFMIDETSSQPYPNIDKIWETNENGEFIYYDKSYYHVAGIANERRYILSMKQGDYYYNIPAVKRGDNYLNLISMEEMKYEKEIPTKKHASISLGFIPKPEKNL